MSLRRQGVERQADYALALKDNQSELCEEVKDAFEQVEDVDCDYCEKVEKSHGRIETRRCWNVMDSERIEYLNDKRERRDLSGVAMLKSERLIEGVRSSQTRYCITSLSVDAKTMLESARSHWG